MTEDRWLAEWMGAKVIEVANPERWTAPARIPAWEFPNGIIVHQADWHPTRDIVQAMMCLETRFKNWRIDHYDNGDSKVTIFDCFPMVAVTLRNLSEAICHAIRQAVEGVEG